MNSELQALIRDFRAAQDSAIDYLHLVLHIPLPDSGPVWVRTGHPATLEAANELSIPMLNSIRMVLALRSFFPISELTLTSDQMVRSTVSTCGVWPYTDTICNRQNRPLDLMMIFAHGLTTQLRKANC